jgi:hypothetical protein
VLTQLVSLFTRFSMSKTYLEARKDMPERKPTHHTRILGPTDRARAAGLGGARYYFSVTALLHCSTVIAPLPSFLTINPIAIAGPGLKGGPK